MLAKFSKCVCQSSRTDLVHLGVREDHYMPHGALTISFATRERKGLPPGYGNQIFYLFPRGNAFTLCSSIFDKELA